MSRINLEDNRLWNPIFQSKTRFGALEMVPADNAVIDPDMPPLLIMNPAGAVDILMPASNEQTRGLFFVIANVSANAITLKTSADAAFATAIALAAGESTLVFCTGSATANLGWRALGTASSA